MNMNMQKNGFWVKSGAPSGSRTPLTMPRFKDSQMWYFFVAWLEAHSYSQEITGVECGCILVTSIACRKQCSILATKNRGISQVKGCARPQVGAKLR